MTAEIVVLDPSETASVLSGQRPGRNETLTKIADNLMAVLDTKASVFATDLNESNVNAIRTKMLRRGIRVSFRKSELDGRVGHVMIARTVQR